MRSVLHSKIEKVTVFRAGALVTRVAELDADDDGFPADIQFGNLPLALDDDTVKVRVRHIDGAGALPIASDVKVGLHATGIAPYDEASHDEALKTAERKKTAIIARRAQLARQIKLLERLSAIPRPEPKEGEVPGPSPTSARLAMLKFRTKRSQMLTEKTRALDLEIEEASKEVELILEKIRTASSAREPRENELRKIATVRLSQTDVEIRRARVYLEYIVPGARWVPAYALKLSDDLETAELMVRAMVRQRTGEDWTNVQLELSTAESQRWTELPELKSIRLGRRQPPSVPRWRPPPTGVDSLYADFDRARNMLPSGSVPLDGMQTGEYEAPAFDDLERTGEYDASEVDVEETGVDLPIPSLPPPGAVPAAIPMSAPMSMARRSASPIAAAQNLIGALSDKMSVPRGGGGAVPGGPPTSGTLPPQQAMGPPRSFARKRSRLDSGPAEPTVEKVLDADAELLRYGQLLMPSATEPRRGHLSKGKLHDRYLEIFVRSKIVVSFDVMHVIQMALGRARSVDRGAPPDGHFFVAPDGFDYAYPASNRVDVQSDGEFHSIPLSKKRGDCTVRFVVVPRETQDVFRVLELINPLDAPLLKGPVDVYVAGDYLMTTVVDTTPSRGRLKIGLGVEQAIKVSRNSTFEERSAGLMRGSLDLLHAIDVELVNHLERTALVEVRERVPITRENDDDIKVSVESADPPWKPYEQDEQVLDGGYRWEVAVLPGETQQLKAAYAVRIPSSEELVGGNRRER